mmetsp:Transcript_25120/g.63151  ORF Transcript_25120/g.63151 Transcript_25120/m.63151 type:complete len:392 (+) Transcript_25120:1832-3007(+)
MKSTPSLSTSIGTGDSSAGGGSIPAPATATGRPVTGSRSTTKFACAASSSSATGPAGRTAGRRGTTRQGATSRSSSEMSARRSSSWSTSGLTATLWAGGAGRSTAGGSAAADAGCGGRAAGSGRGRMSRFLRRSMEAAVGPSPFAGGCVILGGAEMHRCTDDGNRSAGARGRPTSCVASAAGARVRNASMDSAQARAAPLTLCIVSCPGGGSSRAGRGSGTSGHSSGAGQPATERIARRIHLGSLMFLYRFPASLVVRRRSAATGAHSLDRRWRAYPVSRMCLFTPAPSISTPTGAATATSSAASSANGGTSESDASSPTDSGSASSSRIPLGGGPGPGSAFSRPAAASSIATKGASSWASATRESIGCDSWASRMTTHDDTLPSQTPHRM